MNILSIDIGTYSVKFIETKQERKHLVMQNFQEVFVKDFITEDDENFSIVNIQNRIIEKFLQDRQFDGKIIYQIKNDYNTTRYINLPVNNKKKAEMMLPFQLDDNLPYPSSMAHYAATYTKNDTETLAQVNIVQQEHFDDFYSGLKKSGTLPNILTTEVSLIDNYVKENNIIGPCCILDIGHSTTKAYFINNKKIVSNHISHMAGNVLTEVISKTYNIDTQAAIDFKHEKAFFLTSAQYDDVTEDQKEFAILMKKAFTPLMEEINRWKLGFRVKFTAPIKEIFLIGGSSNLKNIDNFISQSTSVKASPLAILETGKLLNSSFGQEKTFNYGIASIMSISNLSTNQPANFLKGSYSAGRVDLISMHSNMFLFTRVLIISLILVSGLLVERFYVSKKQDKLSYSIKKEIKNPQYKISKRDQRAFKKKPEKIYRLLNKQYSILKKEIDAVNRAAKIDELESLVSLSSVLTSNEKVDLISFRSYQNQVSATFKADNKEELKLFQKQVDQVNLPGKKVNVDESSNTLKINYRGK